MKGIVTVDIGTTSVRALLFSAAGRVLHAAQRDNAPAAHGDGRVEQDAHSWPAAVLALLAQCAQAAAGQGVAVQAVAVTAQRSSLIAVDAAGTPLHPAIMWQDTRSAALAQAFKPNEALVYHRTGLKISPVFSAIKMLWLRRERPAVWQATHKLLGVQDWVLWNLTGRHVTDHSFGSRTNLLNLATRRWDSDLLALFEVPEALLCDLVRPGEVVGGLTPQAAAATGLQAGLPVVSAGGDQQCAALGLGLCSADHAVSNTGTGSYLIGHADKPVLDEAMRVSCNVSALPGACIVEAAVLTSGAIYRWFNSGLLRAAGEGGAGFEALNAEAAAAPPGCNGVLLLPHFKGTGSPHWDADARGAFCNLSLASTRGEMARAVLEGIAIELKQSLDVVEQHCGGVAQVQVAGGLTRLPLFNQIQADVLERPVYCLGGDEATSRGAFMAGAVAMGLAASHAAAFETASAAGAGAGPAAVCHPDPALETVYRLQRRRAQAVYHALAAPALRQLFP